MFYVNGNYPSFIKKGQYVSLSAKLKRRDIKKGDLITIEDHPYRVLKRKFNIAEVLGMENCYESSDGWGIQYDYPPRTVEFKHGTIGQPYSESTLDTYLNETYYATLSDELKQAIVPKTITHDMWTSTPIKPTSVNYYRLTTGSGNAYYYAFKDTAETLSRNIYTPSLRDILDYLDTPQNGDFLINDILQMFWNKTEGIAAEKIWLRSASFVSPSITDYILQLRTYNGYYIASENQSSYDKITSARPVFCVDLDKITWSHVDEVT